MKYVELSIEREIDFMIKYQLTADELFVIRLIFYAQDEHDEYLTKFFSQNELVKPIREILQSLQDKGIINKSYKIPDKGSIFNARDVDFNKNVIKEFLRHSQELGMDLFENYPSYVMINGRNFSLRNITKLYKSLDEMCFAYGKEIGFDYNKHQQIMEVLQWAKENNQIHSGLCDFIASHQWRTLQELKDGGMTTFDNVEML